MILVKERALKNIDYLMFVEVAQTLGMHGIHFQSLDAAKHKLKKFGFTL